MHQDKIRSLLQMVQGNHLSIDEAFSQLKNLPFEDLGFAMVDHHRQLRTGCPETIFSEGKTVEQIVGIVQNMLEKNINIMATRAEPEVYEALKQLGKPIEIGRAHV